MKIRTRTSAQREPRATRPNVHTLTAMQETAHLSTQHIDSRVQVLLFEQQVVAADIERASAALQGLRRRRSVIDAQVLGMQTIVASR